VALETLAWLALYAAAVLIFRPFHPTLPIALVATFLLIGSYSAAVLFDRHVIQRLIRQRGWSAYVLTLLLAEAVLTVAAVQSIQGLYDLAWGRTRDDLASGRTSGPTSWA
jgi:hypothetical protein